jgi:hypothetical protein
MSYLMRTGAEALYTGEGVRRGCGSDKCPKTDKRGCTRSLRTGHTATNYASLRAVCPKCPTMEGYRPLLWAVWVEGANGPLPAGSSHLGGQTARTSHNAQRGRERDKVGQRPTFPDIDPLSTYKGSSLTQQDIPGHVCFVPP